MTEPNRTLPSDAAIKAILADRIDVQHRGVGIVVGVIGEEERRVIAHGEMRKGDGRLPDGDTVFEIGSITKVFTALLLADMVERGEVALDDPVAKHLPAGVTMPERAGKQITFAELATHTSGLPRMPDNFAPGDRANAWADYTVDQLHQFISGHTLKRGVGEHCEYSNVGFGLLGHVLALRAGVGFGRLVRQRITGPLGMASTGLPSADLAARLATGHDRAHQPVANWASPTLAGAGALRSTANDLLTFAAAELGYAEAPLKAAMSAQLLTRRPTDADDLEIALGWGISKMQSREIVRKDGGTFGYQCFLGLDMRARVGVAVLTNARVEFLVADDIGLHLLTGSQLAPVARQRRAIALEADMLERYVGRYRGERNNVLSITRAGGQLFAQAIVQGAPTRPVHEICPETESSFFWRFVDIDLTFEFDADGHVTGLVTHRAGRDNHRTRVVEGQ